MNQHLILVEDHRGYRAGTPFTCVATYGNWHVAAAKLEVTHGTDRIEVSEEELDRLFRPTDGADGADGTPE
jgi:hypothetical protein